jgi:hypothetical protein
MEGISTEAVPPPLMLAAILQVKERSKRNKSDGEY